MSGSGPRPVKPPTGEEDSEAWRQKRKKQSDLTEAVERARRRREEEERRMDEQRLAACAEKLKRLNEKLRPAPSASPVAAPSEPIHAVSTTAPAISDAHEDASGPRTDTPAPQPPPQQQQQQAQDPPPAPSPAHEMPEPGPEEEEAVPAVHFAPRQPTPPAHRASVEQQAESSGGDEPQLQPERLPMRDYFCADECRGKDSGCLGGFHVCLSHSVKMCCLVRSHI